MIEKREGQGAEVPKDTQLSEDIQASKNNPISKETKTPKINNFFEKNKIPLIATLSALATGILITIVLVLFLPKTSPDDQNTQSQISVAQETQYTYTNYEKEIKDIYSNISRSDDPAAAKEEYVPQLIEYIDDPQSSTEEKVYAVDTLSRVYAFNEPRDILAAIELLEETLSNTDLNSNQRVNLLGRLKEIYTLLDNRELIIEMIHAIMDTPADASYSKELKQLNDNNLSVALKELEQ